MTFPSRPQKQGELNRYKIRNCEASHTVRAELVEALLLITKPFDRLRANGGEQLPK
jgi:hypothetical protein